MDTVAFILSFEECNLAVLNKKCVFQFGRPSHLHAGHQALPEWDSKCKSGEYSCALAERVAFFLVWEKQQQTFERARSHSISLSALLLPLFASVSHVRKYTRRAMIRCRLLTSSSSSLELRIHMNI
jgi:hypothetical protein